MSVEFKKFVAAYLAKVAARKFIGLLGGRLLNQSTKNDDVIMRCFPCAFLSATSYEKRPQAAVTSDTTLE